MSMHMGFCASSRLAQLLPLSVFQQGIFPFIWHHEVSDGLLNLCVLCRYLKKSGVALILASRTLADFCPSTQPFFYPLSLLLALRKVEQEMMCPFINSSACWSPCRLYFSYFEQMLIQSDAAGS
jgi:hypothetical protein